MPKVIFNDEDHSYYLNNIKGVSANGLLKYFISPFHEEFQAAKKALSDIIPGFYKVYFSTFFEDPTEEELIVFFYDLFDDGEFLDKKQHYIDLWQKNREDGTAFHLLDENKAFDDGFMLNPFDGKKYPCNKYPKNYDNQNIVDNLYDLPDGGYPELLVWLDIFTGQADKVYIETIGDVRYIDIDDLKTNGKVPKNFKGKYGWMKNPVSHMSDDSFNKYELQISIYAYYLECAGFVPRNLGFSHYKNYDFSTQNLFKLQYRKKEVEDVIKFYNDYIR